MDRVVQDLQGIWASQGYGRVLAVDGVRLDVFDVTSSDAVLHESLALDEWLARTDRLNLGEAGRLGHYDQGGITRYDYRRLDELPVSCRAVADGVRDGPDDDPERNFEFFWQSFNENYAFFDERGVDWRATYDRMRPGVNAFTSPARLYDLIVEIIDRIDDRHVLIERPGAGCRYSGHPGTLARLMQAALPAGQEATRDGFMAEAKRLLAQEYLGESKREAVDSQFTWGWAAPGIGYISIDSMEHYVDLAGDPRLRASHRLVDDVMDRAIGDLQDAKGIIVDARWNGGGFDSNALHIAGHFTDQRLLAFSKCARMGAGYLPAQEIFIPWHARKVFTGPVVFLCGRDTLSAAEIFSLAMRAIPNVTSMGEPTVGSLSDTHSIRLPNRWRMQISNERYVAADGKLYEVEGVPVDVELPPNEAATLSSYIRQVTDAAIERLRSL